MNNLSLFTIEESLALLIQAREAAENDGDSDDLKIIDDNIAEYFTHEVKKVDAIAGAVRAYQQAAEELATEEERLRDRRKRFEATTQRIKDNALRAMQAHGVTKLETQHNTLRIQKNGGIQPLEIPIPEELPQEFRMLTVIMPVIDWTKISIELKDRWKLGPQTADQARIREVLKGHRFCPECKDGDDQANCQRCDGKGTIPNTIPGAKLLPRGEHLRVE